MNSKENIKVFYRVSKNVRKTEETKLKQVEDKNGKMIATVNEITERWRDHFDKLLERARRTGQ